MSIEKKSLISNRLAVKKPNLTKATDNPRVTKIESPKISGINATKVGSTYIRG